LAERRARHAAAAAGLSCRRFAYAWQMPSPRGFVAFEVRSSKILGFRYFTLLHFLHIFSI
jgi:hypothetical protein